MWSTARRPALLGLPAVLLGCPPEPAPEAPVPCHAGYVCTVAGTGVNGFDGDGRDARASMLYFPTALAVHPDGRLVIVDYNNMRIRTIEPDGTLATLAGSGLHAWSSPGSDARETAFENPSDIAFGLDGDYFVMAQHEARVVRVGPDGIANVYAGTGDEGYSGDEGPAVDGVLSEAWSVAVGDDGTLYIADTFNHAVRAVDPTGTLHTLAEGLLGPQQVRWADGALWIADAGHHQVVRLDPATGERRVIAGTGIAGYDGDGGPATEATLRSPWGIAVIAGEVWIADSGNAAIRRVDAEGGIDTVAGGREGFEDGAALEASFYFPVGIVGGEEGVYVADYRNGAVRYLR